MNPEELIGSIDFGVLIQSLRELIAEPTSNLTLSVLLLGIVGIILLIFVIVALMFILGRDDEDDEDEDQEDDVEYGTPHEGAAGGVLGLQRIDDGSVEGLELPPSPPGRSSRFARFVSVAGSLTVPLLLIAASVTGYGISAQDRYCLACHADKRAAMEGPQFSEGVPITTPVHNGVRCVRCHEGPQVTGAVWNSIERLRHVAAYARGVRPGKGGSVAQARCLSCHQESISTLLVDDARGLRISHIEPIAAGAPCSECHRSAGHESDAPNPGMSACLRCHDEQTASAACETCHNKDVALAARKSRTFTASATINKGDCGGCHAQDSCDACHGMRMPHDDEFLAYEHARQAGFDKKEACWKCHVLGDCGKCHAVRPKSIGYWGHTTGEHWKRQHSIVPQGDVAGCGCHGRSPWVRRGEDYCLACHEPGIR